MTKTLRWGLLSTARITRRLIPAVRAARGHELRAVASRDPQRANQFAAHWKIPKTYGSYEELIADPEIDVIYNPLPNHLHAEWSVRAAQAGKHVLCEKPLALSPDEVDRITAAAEENHVVIAEAFMYRHQPRTLKMQELVQSGIIGDIRHIDGMYTIKLERPDNYRWLPEAGGGSLWDIGCYPISYARLVMGENPLEAYGVAKRTSLGVDIAFTALLTYANGATGRFFCSYELPYAARMEIQGSLGSLILENPYVPTRDRPIILVKNGREKKINTAVPRLIFQGEVEDLGRAALTGAEQRLTLNESREINLVLTALHRSAAEGLPVRL